MSHLASSPFPGIMVGMGPLTATRFTRTPSTPEIAPAPLPQVRPLWIGPLEVDPPILQAPMAGFTNYAFRQIVREFGGAGGPGG